METLALIQNHEAQLPYRIDRLSLTEEQGIFVVRDDLLPAGTKQRAILPLLDDFIRKKIRHVTYASPFAGFAQVALAYGCNVKGVRCTLFCEKDPNQSGSRPHPFTELAARWGAEIFLVDDLETGERSAAELSEKHGCHKIPLGFHCQEFQQHFQRAVREGLKHIRQKLGFFPARAWLPVGSGTLCQAFHQACEGKIEIHCVDVHVLPENDFRIQAVRDLPNVHYYSASELFKEPALKPPTIPSNIHYDAKLWAIIKNSSRSGDLWWNVAR